jgi:seipin
MDGRDDDDEDKSVLQLVSDNLTVSAPRSQLLASANTLQDKFRQHAPPLVRLSLRTVFLGPLAFLLALISLIAFIHLRHTHVPRRSFSANVQLQYPAAPDVYALLRAPGEAERGSADEIPHIPDLKDLSRMRIHHPYGVVDGISTHLVPNQGYDVAVELVLPRSPRNAEAGNFMIALDLIASEKQPQTPPTTSTVASGRIPAVMTYLPPFVDKIRQLLKAPLLILGLGKEEELVRKTVLEGVKFGKKHGRLIPDSVRLEVQRQGWNGQVMEVSEAKVEFTAGFSGLRSVALRSCFPCID